MRTICGCAFRFEDELSLVPGKWDRYKLDGVDGLREAGITLVPSMVWIATDAD
jgi:hypothetical protein